MGKLQRPLDPEAVEAADENLYAAHGSDPRPNALYDADGNQIPLDGSDPALNQEWEAQYNKALNNKTPEPSDSASNDAGPERQVGGHSAPVNAPSTKAPPAFGPQPVGCATQQCAKTHKIKIILVKLPDLKARPDWWMKEKKWPYPYEPFSAVITDGPKKGALDGSGDVGYSGIPGGSCSIKFTQFYDAIVKQLDRDGTVPIASDPDDKGKSLVLKGADAPFAPGVEKLNVSYDIHNLEKDTVIFQIESSKTPGTPIFERTLTDDEKSSGNGKVLSWDGMATLGPKSGKWIGPGDSPYVVIMKVDSEGMEQKINTRVEIQKIELEITPPNKKIILNVPETNILVTSRVLLRQKTGGGMVTPVEMDVVFTFTPNATNISAKDSFVYATPKTLGKKGDPSAVYWEPHKDHPSTTPDNYNKTCKAQVITTTGGEQGKAKTWFRPSAVGGNKYKLKATVFASDGATSLAHKETAEVTIWRKVVLTPYEMIGQRHISKHGTVAIISGYYKPDTFVEYELGKSNTVPAASKVTYIGLWDHATGKQLVWATHSAKTPTETPSAQQIADSNGKAGPAQFAAQTAIQAMADAWRDRIIKTYKAGMNSWAADANIPINSIVAIEFEHPKYSANAPAADSETQEWPGLPWLKITVEGKQVTPDSRWVRGLGVSWGKRAYVLAGDLPADTEVTVAHEAGHETKNQFFRADFGPDHDHSPKAGLMDPTGSRNAFTAREKEILRGQK